MIRGLAQRFAFDEWRGRSTLAEELFVWSFAFTGPELPAWQLVELNRLPPAAGAPATTRAVWRSTGRRGERVMEVQVSECDSRLEAHEMLLGALRQFQSPLVRRDESLGVGDVAFAGPAARPTMILFARANLVYLLRNRSALVVPVVDAAAGCDATVTARPSEAPADTAAPRIAGVARPAARVGDAVAVTLDPGAILPAATAAAEVTPILGRAFATGGELVRVNGELVFRPADPGRRVVDVFAQRASETPVAQRLELDVE